MGKARCRCEPDWGGPDCSKSLASLLADPEEVAQRGQSEEDVRAPAKPETANKAYSAFEYGYTPPPFTPDASDSDIESDAILMGSALLGIVVVSGAVGLSFHFCRRNIKEGPNYARVPVLEGDDSLGGDVASNSDDQWGWGEDDEAGQIELQKPITTTIAAPGLQLKGMNAEQPMPLLPPKNVELAKTLPDPTPDDLFATLGMNAQPVFNPASIDPFSSTLQPAESFGGTGTAWNDDLSDLDGL
jgi:hypothetical protein